MFALRQGTTSLCRVALLMAPLFGMNHVEAADVVLDFEELSLPAESADVADETQSPIVSQGVSFNRTWNSEFNCCPGAWASSNQTDLTSAGFGNAYSAYHLPGGGGFDGSANYLVAFDSTGAEAEIELPEPMTVRGLQVTNTTYGYLAVAEGRDTLGSEIPAFVKGPFEDGDFFRLTVTGLNALDQPTGSVDFYLADYRDGKREVVSSWTWLDLTPLGGQVSSLAFEMDSTDVGMFGMNTPAFFAIDNLTLAVVPEPQTWSPLIFFVVGWLLSRRCRGQTIA